MPAPVKPIVSTAPANWVVSPCSRDQVDAFRICRSKCKHKVLLQCDRATILLIFEQRA